VDRLCHILNVTSRGYRAWCNRPVSQRQRDGLVVLAHIRDQHHLSLGSYGRPRMTQELKEAGGRVGHRRVGRLMRDNGIRLVKTDRYKTTTDTNHRFNIAPNVLDRNFHAERPNQKWAGDISYIWTREGWLYLAALIDLHSRRVVGWAVSNRVEEGFGITRTQPRCGSAEPASRLHSSHRSRQPRRIQTVVATVPNWRLR